MENWVVGVDSFIIISILFYFSTIAFAQLESESSVGFGIKLGGNFTGNIFDKGPIEGKRKLILNYHVGALIQIPLTLNLKIQPEIQFLRSGYKSSFTKDNAKYDITQRISYLTIPVSLTYHFRDISPQPYLSVGPYVGYALRGSTKSVVKTKIDNKTETTNAKQAIDFNEGSPDHLKRFDVGFMLGAGMDLDLFIMEFKYTQSITSRYTGLSKSAYGANMNLALSLIFVL